MVVEGYAARMLKVTCPGSTPKRRSISDTGERFRQNIKGHGRTDTVRRPADPNEDAPAAPV
jgi:hypothetical protein